MGKIEDLINKVKNNNWSVRSENVDLLKTMLNNWKFYNNAKSKNENDYENENDYNYDRVLINTYQKGIDFLNRNIEEVVKIVKKEREYFKIFHILQNEKSVKFLFEFLMNEKEVNLCGQVSNALGTIIQEDDSSYLWFEKFLPGLNPDLNKLADSIKGRNAKYFWEIIDKISNDNNQYKFDLYKRRKKEFCGIKSMEECTEFIPPIKNEYFIAYPFSNEKVFSVIKDSFKERWRNLYSNESLLNPIAADKRIDDRNVLCDICKKIHYTKFGVYILSASKKNCNNFFCKIFRKPRKINLPNPNVMLELGLAMKIGKPYLLIFKRGTHPISDLGGNLRIDYNDYPELKEKIVKFDNIESFLNLEVKNG